MPTVTKDEYTQSELDWFNNGTWNVYKHDRLAIDGLVTAQQIKEYYQDNYPLWVEHLDTHFKVVDGRGEKYVQPLIASDYYTQDELDWFNNIDYDFDKADFGPSHLERSELFKFCVAKGWCPDYEWNWKLYGAMNESLEMCVLKSESKMNSDYDRCTSDLKIIEFITKYGLADMNEEDLRIIRDHPERYNVPKDIDVERLFDAAILYQDYPEYIDNYREIYEANKYVMDFVKKYDLRNKMHNDLNEKLVYFAYYSLANQK